MNDSDFETELPSMTEELHVEKIVNPVETKKEDVKIQEPFSKIDKELVCVLFVILASLISHNEITNSLITSLVNSDQISFIIQCVLTGLVFYAINNLYKRI